MKDERAAQRAALGIGAITIRWKRIDREVELAPGDTESAPDMLRVQRP